LTFWNDMKYYTDHPKDSLHVLLLSMYEDWNPGSAILKDNYTPLDFINPMGLNELHLTVQQW